jgi:hypothetical protein
VNNAVLTTYLNDHLAGSVAALELLDHLIDSHEEPDRAVLRELRNEISQDRQVLQRLLADLWRALAVLERAPHLVSLDLAQLQARATGQFDRVEQLRLRVARSALAS